ncbi:MAG TPA: histidine phosphatase family protein [Gemmatimonadales bacterium]|nr:histidine phosphatase family protein [Gemmatimonadales bacterium]
MNRSALALALLLAPGCAVAQGTGAAPGTKTVVILVRHAEKASETENDPSLSARGRARAAALAEALRDAGLTGAIVSERRRTHETAAPAIAGIVPDTVSIRDGAAAHARAVAERIRSRHAGGTVLVVGHSNTIPAIMSALGAGPLPDICDAAYANLYIMVLDRPDAPQVMRTKFGAPDPAGADDCPGMRAP